jgi:hypothetical protein
MPGLHAQLPQTANVAGSKEVYAFARAADPRKTKKDGDENWTATVVNPSELGTMTDKALFWLHLLVWVAALFLSAFTNFGATGWMGNGTNATGWREVNEYHGITTTTTTIAVLGGIASIGGVLCLVGSAAWFTAKEFAGTGYGLIANVFIQFLTLFGTTSTFYVFSRAAEQTGNGYYGLALTAVIFLTYAQVLLYCTSSAMGVAALPRAFIPSLAGSVQFISALAINSGDFAPAATVEQKTIAWLVPIFTVTALVMMFGIRIGTKPGGFLSRLPKQLGGERLSGEVGRTGKLTVSNIKNRPFLRSLFLTPYLVSGILSVYKLSFVKLDADPTSYVFSLFGMLLNFAIIGVVFNPSAELVGIDEDLAEAASDLNESLLEEASITGV